MLRPIYIPLPESSRLSGRPVVAAAVPYVERPEDCSERCPPGALVLDIQWPSAAVFLQMPQALPGTLCFRRLDRADQIQAHQRSERWQDWFLSLAIRRPTLAPEQIEAYLGADRDVLAKALLRLWSITEDADGELPRMPEPAYLEGLRAIALRLRRPPSEFLRGPLPEFIFNWRTLGIWGTTSAAAESGLSEDMIEN